MRKYLDLLKKGGATKALLINPSEVVTAPWPVMKCKYGCPNYGHNRCCPPNSPDWHEMRHILEAYTRAILFEVSDIRSGTPLAVSTARELFRDGFYKAVPFGTGPCRLCEKCLGADCPRPWDTAPSMEACGVDVFATVRQAGIEVKTSVSEGDTPQCFGLILID